MTDVERTRLVALKCRIAACQALTGNPKMGRLLAESATICQRLIDSPISAITFSDPDSLDPTLGARETSSPKMKPMLTQREVRG